MIPMQQTKIKKSLNNNPTLLTTKFMNTIIFSLILGLVAPEPTPAPPSKEASPSQPSMPAPTMPPNSSNTNVFLLEDVMPVEVQQKTGIANLTSEQKQALTIWLNQNFILKSQVGSTEAPSAEKTPTLYLSENIDGGKKLRLTDGSLYEVSPDDVNLTSFWITPFPMKILPSRDQNYPFLLVNLNTGTAIKAKQLSPPTIPPSPPAAS